LRRDRSRGWQLRRAVLDPECLKALSLTLCLQLIGEPRTSRQAAQPIHKCGAIAVADLLITRGRSEADLVTMLSSLAATAIDIDDEVAASEAESGFATTRWPIS
jgi:hypothetical protein